MLKGKETTFFISHIIMTNNCGRTCRCRRRKFAKKSNLFGEDENLNLLCKWMGENGFKPSKQLRPKYFEESGRGLMTKERIYEGDPIVSIPENLLITPIKILKTDLECFFKRHAPNASGHQILSVFLMCERAKLKDSKWYPYLNSLPRTYDIPCFSENYKYFEILPFISSLAKKQVELVKSSYEQLKSLLKNLVPLFPNNHSAFNFEIYKWAWCTVNTRCVYIDCYQKNCPGKNCSYHLALVPYLDLLNHSAEVQVQAGFCESEQKYEIRSLCNFKKYSQVFINYGPHGNRSLLVEYGFVVPNNENDSVPFCIEEIIKAYEESFKTSTALTTKMDFIHQNNLLVNAVCSCDGLSWNLNIILKMLSSNYPINWWKSNLKDNSYSKTNEDQKYQTMKKKLLSLKLEDYNIEDTTFTKTSSYLQQILLNLLTMEKSILTNTLQ